MRKLLVPVLCAVVLATGCGREKVLNRTDPVDPAKPSTPVPTGPQNVSLVVFGAGYCEVCKSKFPEVDSLLKQFSADARGRVAVKLYVTSGAPASVKPTQELADSYKEHYLPGANSAQPDKWRWTLFKQLIPGKLDVPAAAVLDEKGNVLKTYVAGDTTFVPAEIVAFVGGKAKGTN